MVDTVVTWAGTALALAVLLVMVAAGWVSAPAASPAVVRRREDR
ncbi:hypothetical protein [Rhodococcus aerolatus]